MENTEAVMTEAATTVEAAAVTKRDNRVTLIASSFRAVNYVSNSLVITSGQPSDQPATIKNTQPNWEILIRAGRKRSKEVAVNWINATGGGNNSFAPEGGANPPPKELNFYYALDIATATGNSTRLYVGQGSFSDTNNWWVGGADVVAIDNKAVLALGSGTTRETYTLSGTNDTIVFTKR